MTEVDLFNLVLHGGGAVVLFIWNRSLIAQLAEATAEIMRLNSVLIDKLPSVAQYLETDK